MQNNYYRSNGAHLLHNRFMTNRPAHSWADWWRLLERKVVRKAYKKGDIDLIRAVTAQKLNRIENRLAA